MKILTILMLVISLGFSQEKAKKAQPSPRATVSQVIGLTKVMVDYGRPAVNGRKVFGGLEKFDKVWRTGANEQTEIEFSDDLLLNGNKIMKGRYALFTIPRENNKWTVILNKDLGKWGAFSYVEANDALRFDVDAMTTENQERLLFTFENLTLSSGDLVLSWADKTIKINITTM